MFGGDIPDRTLRIHFTSGHICPGVGSFFLQDGTNHVPAPRIRCWCSVASATGGKEHPETGEEIRSGDDKLLLTFMLFLKKGEHRPVLVLALVRLAVVEGTLQD